MGTTVTGKLNKAANQHPNASGVTFFVEIGEQNYNHKTKQKEWTNYSCALFAKDSQIEFYTGALVAGAIVSVSCTGLLIDMPTDPKYKPRLQMQEAKLEFVDSPANAPQQQYQQAPQQAPQQAHQMQQAPAQQVPQQVPQQAPQQQYQQAPAQQIHQAAQQMVQQAQQQGGYQIIDDINL